MSVTPSAGSISVTEERSDLWIVALAGEHDLATAPLIHSQTRDVWARASCVVVDLSATSFIDSSTVVRWLLDTQRALESVGGCTLSVVEGLPGSIPERLFGLLQMREKLACYATREDALAADAPRA
jgi:anti-anti-sigma factor